MQDSGSVEIRFRLHPGADPKQPTAFTGATGSFPRVTQIMALALHFEAMIDRGEAEDYADLARLGGVSRERISQIMKFLWLAPDIQQELIYLPPTSAGRYPLSETAVRKISQILSWAEQRLAWMELKGSHHVGAAPAPR